MENKKSVLITIIVLLCIFVPLTVVGLFKRINISPLEENPNHDTYYDNYMWFYNSNDEFLSKYECMTKICEYTNPTIDDDTYNINYYKDGNIKTVSLINDKFTFITDGALINLYDASTGRTLKSYKTLKTYNTKIENNSFILQDENNIWGVISVGDVLTPVLPFEYSFIGLKNNLNEDGTLSYDKFIVSKDTKWFIVDNTNSALSGYIDDPIIDYTNEYIFSKSSDKIRIYSYQNYEYLVNYTISDYIVEDKYIGIVTDNNLLIFKNLGVGYIKNIELTDSSKIELKMDSGKLNIKINDILVETIE